jgi:hypothetical protein
MVKKGTHYGTTSIASHGKKFSHLGDLETRICASLVLIVKKDSQTYLRNMERVQ